MLIKRGTKLAAAALAAAISMMPLPLLAEEEVSDVAFCAPGVYEYESSLHELYEEDGKMSAYVPLWKNESRVLKAVVRAESDTTVTMTCEPLTSAKSADTVAVKGGLLEATSASLAMGTDPNAPHLSVPDIMSDKTEVSLAAGETAFFWLRLEASDIAAGTYRGQVRFEGTKNQELRLEAAVNPLALEADSVSLNLWQYPYASRQYYESLRQEEFLSDAHLEVLRNELSIYKEAGGSHITCAISEEPWAHQTYPDTPSLVTWNRDGNGFLWFDFTKFDRYVDLCESLGINGPIDCFSILPFDQAITVYNDMGEPERMNLYPGDETWRLYWENFMYAFIQHQKETGRLERTTMFVDERGIEFFSTMLDFVRSLEGGDALRFGVAMNVIPRDTALYDQFDEVSISIASVPENDAEFDTFLAHRKELGLSTTMYNCSTNYPNAFLYSDPCESVWTMLYLEARGFDGYLRWALNAWPADPLRCGDNPHFEAGDTFLIYPDEASSDHAHARNSMRLAMIEQGLNDIRKVRVLRGVLDEESAAILEEGLRSIQRCYGTYNAYGAMSAISEDNRRIIAFETLRMEQLIQKAALTAAVAQRGKTVSRLKEEMKVAAQYQP